MRHLITFFAILALSRLYSQDLKTLGLSPDQVKILNKYSSEARFEASGFNVLDTVDQPIDNFQYQRLLNQEFTKVVDANNSAGQGTFASLDTDKSQIKYSMTIIPGKDNPECKGRTAVTISLEGSNSDNVLPIYSKDDFAKQVGFGIQFHHRLSGDKIDRISYTRSALKAQRAKEKAVNRAYDVALRNILLDVPYLTIQGEIEKAEKERKKLQDSIAKDSRVLAIRQMQVKIQELSLQIEDKQKEIASLDARGEKKRQQDQLRLLMVEWSKNIKAARSELKPTGFRTMWISYGVSFNHNKFKLFDESLAFADQLMDTAYMTKKVMLSLSGLYKKDRMFYWTIGADYSITDNFTDFSEVTVRSREDYDEMDPDARFVITETKAYSDDEPYEQDLGKLILRGDVYWFFLKSNSLAIHGYPRFNIAESVKNTRDFGLGIFTSLPKKGEAGSAVNAELFYEFLDLKNANDEEGNIFKRSNLGLRVNVPINF